MCAPAASISGTFTEAQREEALLFLHALLRVNVVQMVEAERWHMSLFNTRNPIHFDSVLGELNKGLKFADLEVRKFRHPDGWGADAGLEFLSLVNLSDDSVAKFATSFSDNEVALVRAVLEALARAEDAALTPDQAVSLREGLTLPTVDQHGNPGPSTAAGLSAAEAEEVLRRLEAGKWVARASARGSHLTLGVRALLELPRFLRDVDGCSEEVARRLDQARAAA